MFHLEDRRRKRSADPLIALHYQLSHARQDGSLDTVVLADPSGVVVAGAGAWAACEELAAYAPLFTQKMEEGPVSSRIASMRNEVEVRPITISGQEVLLCARGSRQGIDGVRDVVLARVAAAVSRILSAA